jgi:glycerol-3-phosphate acyltransferase PlsY
MSAIPLVLVVGYLLGAIPFGVIVARSRGLDLRQHGSGNIGATNVLRVLGPKYAAIVFLLDGGKGAAAVLVARALLPPPQGPVAATYTWVVAAGLLAVVGHTASVFLRFHGGRGVATGVGVLFGLSWPVALVALAIFIAAVASTRYISFGSILAAAAAPGLMYVFHGPPAYVLFVGLMALLIIWRHRPNIKRLLAGTESRFGRPEAPAERSPDG